MLLAVKVYETTSLQHLHRRIHSGLSACLPVIAEEQIFESRKPGRTATLCMSLIFDEGRARCLGQERD